MGVEIEGGSSQHRQLLQRILAQFGPTEIRRLALGRHVVRPVPGDLPTPEQARAASGVLLQVSDPTEPNLRMHWEAQLIAAAFRAAAEDEGLEPVVWLELRGQGNTLQHARGPKPPLSATDLQEMLTDLQAAACKSYVELKCVDLVQPSGHGFALRLYTPEPHGFLRLHYADFDAAIRPWRARCGNQVYLQVDDDGEEPVLIAAGHGHGGAGRSRRDVDCCDPTITFSTPLLSRRPTPECPIFG